MKVLTQFYFNLKVILKLNLIYKINVYVKLQPFKCMILYTNVLIFEMAQEVIIKMYNRNVRIYQNESTLMFYYYTCVINLNSKIIYENSKIAYNAFLIKFRLAKENLIRIFYFAIQFYSQWKKKNRNLQHLEKMIGSVSIALPN